MTIIDLLKSEEHQYRISGGGNAWLLFDENAGLWKVYSRGYRERTSKLLIETDNEELAVEVLIANH